MKDACANSFMDMCNEDHTPGKAPWDEWTPTEKANWFFVLSVVAP